MQNKNGTVRRIGLREEESLHVPVVQSLRIDFKRGSQKQTATLQIGCSKSLVCC